MNLTVQDVIGDTKPEIIGINENKSLKEAISYLKKYSILSLPVFNKEGKCIGLVDVLDCVAFAIQTFKKNENMEWKNYVMQFSFDLALVKDVMDISRRNPFILLPLETNLCTIIKHFGEGVHRIVIHDGKGNVTHILTQSTLLRFIFEENNWEQLFPSLKAIANKTVRELKMGRQLENGDVVHTVRGDAKAIDAFQKMSENGVSAVGVVNKKNEFIGNISASDLQGFLDEEIFLLANSVVEFQKISFKKKSESVLDEKKRQLKWEVEGVCKMTDTFIQIIQKILSSRVHRVYIINEEMELLGLISITDIFKTIYTNLK